jgi:transcriptional regulator with XRE-family HTH domain
MRSSHIGRKENYAATAQAGLGGLCDTDAMRKAHPVRPHLRAWRLKMGKTQEWLAERISKNQSNVNKAESGKAGVDEQTFAKIADAYGITIAELSAHPDEAPRAQQMHRLMHAIRTMDRDNLETLARLAEQLQRP